MKNLSLLIFAISISFGSCKVECVHESNPLDLTYQEGLNWESAKSTYEADLSIPNCENMHSIQELYLQSLEHHEDCVADEHKTAYNLRLAEVRNYEIVECNTLPIDWNIHEFEIVKIDINDDGVDDFIIQYIIFHVAFNWDEGQCENEVTPNDRIAISARFTAIDYDHEVLIYDGKYLFISTSMRALYNIQSDEEILSTPEDALWTSEIRTFSASIRRLESTCDWQDDWVRASGESLTHKIAVKMVDGEEPRLGYVVVQYDERTHQATVVDKKLF